MTEAFSILLLLLPAPASAAELSISASVDKTVVALNDQVQLTVEVSGPSMSLPDPVMPSLPNFSVFSSGRSQNISMVNGQVESSLVFTYSLAPRFVGKAVIAPITVSDGGKTAGSDPIEVQVVRPSGSGSSPAPGAAAPGGAPRHRRPAGGEGGPDIFVEASVDKPRAFVNEQVTLTIRVFDAVVLMGNPEYGAPDTSGFFTEDLPPLRTYQKTLHGRVYYVTEVKTALFAAAPGRKTIGPALIKAQVQENMRLDPYASDFFQKFFQFGGGAGRGVEVRSDPVTVEIEALPEAGRPKDFSGAVGRFSLSAVLSRPALKVGDAADLNLIVEGEGNLKTVFAPKLPELRSFRVYDTLSSLSLRKEGDVVHGSKTFKTIIVPRASGRTAIPAVPFSFFDPRRREYVTRSVGPIPVQVEASNEPATALGPALSPQARGPVAVESDIQFIHERRTRRPWTAALAAFAGLGRLHALPGAFLLACAGIWGLRLRRMRLDPRVARFQQALPAARRRLLGLRHDGEPADAIPLLGETLTRYLADKLGVPPNGLTLRQASALLRASAPDLASERLQEVQALWEELDVLRYAPARLGDGRNAVKELAHRMEALFTLLEREIRL